MFPWPVLMLLQNIFASVFALQSRRLARQYHVAHFQILVAVFVVVYAVFLGYAALNWSNVSLSMALDFWPHIVFTGLLFTGWTVLTFIVYRFVDAAIGTLFATLNLVAVVIISSLVLQESLTLTQLFGAFLLFGATVIVLTAHLSNKRKQRWEIGLLITIVASLCFGGAITSEKFLLDHIGMPTYAVFGIGAQVVPLALLGLLYHRHQFQHFKDWSFSKQVLIMGLVRAGAGLLFVLSLVSANNASLIGALSGLKILITAILAAIFLRETQFMRRKVAAGIVGLVGVGVMLW